MFATTMTPSFIRTFSMLIRIEGMTLSDARFPSKLVVSCASTYDNGFILPVLSSIPTIIKLLRFVAKIETYVHGYKHRYAYQSKY